MAAARKDTPMSEAASVIIGGGLAGSAFAIELARHRRTVVLEKTDGPIIKYAASSSAPKLRNCSHSSALTSGKWAPQRLPISASNLADTVQNSHCRFAARACRDFDWI